MANILAVPRELLGVSQPCRSHGTKTAASISGPNNVNLVLAGHTLFAARTGDEGVRAQNVTGLKIVGGTIVGYRFGILLDNTPNTRVVGVTVGASRVGIFVANTTGALLSGNTAHRRHGQGTTTWRSGRYNLGFLTQLDSNRVVGNTATGNSPDLADLTCPPAATAG